MVCRLLDYSSELDLARALNAHLGDPHECRGITRHLRHQRGAITFASAATTVAIRTPDAPRIARALATLIEQLTHPISPATGGPSPTRSSPNLASLPAPTTGDLILAPIPSRRPSATQT